MWHSQAKCDTLRVLFLQVGTVLVLPHYCVLHAVLFHEFS